jgi:uncharacterized phage protein (TIGR02218 family)
MDSLRKTRAMFQATCYHLTRLDGVELKFTDADEPITLEDGLEYLPAGGANSSARRKAVDLGSQDVELLGVLSSAAITHADLAAGKYRGAEIQLYLVDKRRPWAGAWHHHTFWVGETKFNHDQWTASIEGFSERLGQESGNVASKHCHHELGAKFGLPAEVGCHLDLAALTTTGHTITDVEVLSPRTTFYVAPSLSEADGHFNLGKIIWQTGDNAGTFSRLDSHLSVGGREEFYLFLETSLDIQVGDTFDLAPGCNKQAGITTDNPIGDCKLKYDNFLDFGGEPRIPGTGKLLGQPN